MTDRYTTWLSQIEARDAAIAALFGISVVFTGLCLLAELFPVPIAFYMRRLFGALAVVVYVALFALALTALVGPAIATR